jgi:hypothetical protein
MGKQNQQILVLVNSTVLYIITKARYDISPIEQQESNANF